MATTFVDYTGDGNATKAFSFPSIQESDIKVEVDTVLKSSGTHYNITNYTTTGGGNVVFTSGNIPSSPAAIRIFRDTNVDSAKATYTAGSSVKAADLNANHEQLLFAAQEEQNQTVITSRIKDAAVTTAKLVADAVTGAKIADDQINSEHYVDGSIDTAHIADAQITTAKIAADAVTNAKIADDSIDSEHYVDGSIDTAHIADSQVTTTKIADDAVTADKLANSINTEIAANTAKTTNQTHTGDVTGSVALTIASGAVTTAKIADANITTAKIASSAVTTDKIADGELTTLAGMQSGTASKLADSTALTADLADLNQLDGMAKQTTITDDDTKFPTSGAIVDYVANQLSIFGGFTAIANESQFPNTQKASGAAISISDAGGLVVNGSGVSTSATTVGGTTVTINNIPSSFHSSTITAGVRLIVTSTGSGQIYNYHKATIREEDLASLSGDINDFGERYRVGSTNPTTSLDAGDLFFNTGSGKLLVYNGTSAAWEETQSVGNFFINTLSSSSATGGGSATPNGTAYRFTLSDAGANAQQHLVSVDGVIQKPNSGSSQPSEGFAISSNDIIFGSAPVSGASIFVITIGASVSIGTPSNNTVTTAILQNGSVTTAKIVDANVTTAKITDANVTTAKIADSAVTSAKIADGAIVNADVNASAAIAGTKISPNFGSQDITTTGHLDLPDDAILKLGNSDDLQILHQSSNGNSVIQESGGGSLSLQTNGSNITMYDSANGRAMAQFITDGACKLKHGATTRLLTSSTGIDVTGNITVSGTVDGVDIAALNTTVGNINTDLVNDTSPQLGGDLDTNSFEILLDDAHAVKFGDSQDAEIKHTGNDLVIRNTEGNIRIEPKNGELGIQMTPDANVSLYYDNSKKLETTSGGVTVTGTCTATAFSGDGSALTGIQGIPSGVIMIWSGAANAIPSGFVLCNGQNSTPNLIDRFVVGAGSVYSVGATGGATSDTDTVNISVSGQCTVSTGGDNLYIQYTNASIAQKRINFAATDSDTVTIDTLPPYYALCYIMKT